MLYLLGILKSPALAALDLPTKEIIHEVVLLADEYHQDPFTALAIIKCESGFHFSEHTNDNGTTDYGYFQINDTHSEEASAEGLSLLSPYQNLKYGMELLSREGTAPWNASRLCWLGPVRAAP